ncbi:MAG TPA: lmo0937 family membrane protein [Terracidiphilus sp.]|nr:lmo0937 family membrane protein [Terracidiphilus sp.]
MRDPRLCRGENFLAPQPRTEAIRSYTSDAYPLRDAAQPVARMHLQETKMADGNARVGCTADCRGCSLPAGLLGASGFLKQRTTSTGSEASKRVGVGGGQRKTPPEVAIVLWTIFVILLVLWLVGLISSYTLGGFIHLLLVLALIVLILQLVSGRRGPIA